MADLHDLMSKFIEETVTRAVNERLQCLSNEADQRVLEVIDGGSMRLNEAMLKSTAEMEARIQRTCEQSLHSLEAEAERVIERTSQRMNELAHKAMDDLPVMIQEHMIAMVQESEAVFHKRSEAWIAELQVESAELVRKRLTAELAESARSICDRNLFEFRSEFENHVNRTFANFADRLATPFPGSTVQQ